jgi:hypothetical protein
MPKGHRSERGYVTTETFDGGLSYREIAEVMSATDAPMNHSSVRNQMLSALSKIADELTVITGKRLSESELKAVAGDPRFQGALCGIIRDRIDT